MDIVNSKVWFTILKQSIINGEINQIVDLMIGDKATVMQILQNFLQIQSSSELNLGNSDLAFGFDSGNNEIEKIKDLIKKIESIDKKTITISMGISDEQNRNLLFHISDYKSGCNPQSQSADNDFAEIDIVDLLCVNLENDKVKKLLMHSTEVGSAEEKARKEHLDNIKADVECIDVYGNTVLFNPNLSTKVAKYFINLGVKADQKNNKGHTALFFTNSALLPHLIAGLNVEEIKKQEDEQGNTLLKHLQERVRNCEAEFPDKNLIEDYLSDLYKQITFLIRCRLSVDSAYIMSIAPDASLTDLVMRSYIGVVLVALVCKNIEFDFAVALLGHDKKVKQRLDPYFNLFNSIINEQTIDVKQLESKLSLDLFGYETNADQDLDYNGWVTKERAEADRKEFVIQCLREVAMSASTDQDLRKEIFKNSDVFEQREYEAKVNIPGQNPGSFASKIPGALLSCFDDNVGVSFRSVDEVYAFCKLVMEIQANSQERDKRLLSHKDAAEKALKQLRGENNTPKSLVNESTVVGASSSLFSLGLVD